MNIDEQYDRIYRYCFFRLHNHHAAEDLTQETFLRFLESRHYRDENKQMQYLYTIARNLCADSCRTRPRLCGLDEAFDLPEQDGFEQTLISRISLKKALLRLPPEERELLFLRYVSELPVPVIAGLYRSSRFAVYRKLNGALRRLRDALREDKNNTDAPEALRHGGVR